MRNLSIVFLSLGLWTTGISAQTRPPSINLEQFEYLIKLIKPMAGESPWREVPWMLDLAKAREKAAEKGKPLLIFTAADGNPLGRT